jgi:transposase
MPRGPKAVPLNLSEAGRAELRRLLRRRGVGQALAQRIRVVLACAEPGATNLGVATALGVSRQTVATWRRRFAADRLEGLADAPRSGAPRTIGDEAVERLVALTLEEAPRNATHWSTRSMARRAGMSQTAVSRIWRAFGLRPHRAETFKLSSDPTFVDKVRDIVGLYLAPPERALVLCVDEKPCVDGPRPARGMLSFGAAGCLRSCVRPCSRSAWTAGPDGFRGSGPQQILGLETLGFSRLPRSVGTTDHAIALLPLASVRLAVQA